MLSARAAVRSLDIYSPPLGDRTGLRLDFNENVGGCSPRVLHRFRELTAGDLGRDSDSAPAELAVAEFLQLHAGEVLLTNGVDEAIHLICETYLKPGDEAIVVTPTFAMYELYARATGASVVRVQADTEFRFPADDVLAAVSPRTRLIAIA